MFSCYHNFFSSPFPLPFSPNVNRHCRGQEWSDLLCWWHHNPKGGPERHHLHFSRFQWPDISSPSDLWQQHGHQSGDLYTHKCPTVVNPLCAHTVNVTETPCVPTPLTLFRLAHLWLIIDMQGYISPYILHMQDPSFHEWWSFWGNWFSNESKMCRGIFF